MCFNCGPKSKKREEDSFSLLLHFLLWQNNFFFFFSSWYCSSYFTPVKACNPGLMGKDGAMWKEMDEFSFFFFFRVYGSSQSRGQIGTAAASLHHSHSNIRSELCLWPKQQLTEMPIFNSPSKARDQTWVLMDNSRVHYHWATVGTPLESSCILFINAIPKVKRRAERRKKFVSEPWGEKTFLPYRMRLSFGLGVRKKRKDIFGILEVVLHFASLANSQEGTNQPLDREEL